MLIHTVHCGCIFKQKVTKKSRRIKRYKKSPFFNNHEKEPNNDIENNMIDA